MKDMESTTPPGSENPSRPFRSFHLGTQIIEGEPIEIHLHFKSLDEFLEIYDAGFKTHPELINSVWLTGSISPKPKADGSDK